MTTNTAPGEALYITGAELLDPSQRWKGKGELLCEEGKIVAVGKPGELKAKAKSLKAITFSATGKLLLPGFLDLNCRIPEPGQEQVESFATGSLAAAAGGFTCLAVKPDTDPVNDNAFMTDFVVRRARERSLVRVFPVGALSAAKEGKRLAEIGSMAAAGARAVSDGWSLSDSYLMRKALEYTRAFSLPVFTQAEDRQLAGQGVMNEGVGSNRLGLRGIPAAAEEIMVARDIVLARHTSGRIHFHSVSTRGALAMIRSAKAEGVRVTADTSPQYFSLTCDAIASYDANYKCFPPLREEEDRQAVVAALADGTLDAIASAHSPQPLAAKEQAFEAAAPGMVGLETAFPLALRLVREKKLKLERLVELFSGAPARILGVEKELGCLRTGANADFAVVDMELDYEFTEKSMLGAARNTPFLGERFKGAVVATIVNGRLVFQRTPPKGKIR